MEVSHYLLQIVETGVVLILLPVFSMFARKVVTRTLKKFEFTYERRKIIVKLLNFLSLTTGFILIAIIWGINHTRLIVFLTSILTVMGIALFAQWSLLSNITASLILFFNHPLKLGDRIKILDKDYPIEGKIEDITYFFLHIRTDKGEKITIPNALVLQKSLSIEPAGKHRPVSNRLRSSEKPAAD